MYLVQEEVLRGEILESLLKVQTSLEILQLFRSTYEDRRANLSQYQRNGVFVRPWDFSPLLAFSGLERFINRIRTIEVSMKALCLPQKLKNSYSISYLVQCEDRNGKAKLR